MNNYPVKAIGCETCRVERVERLGNTIHGVVMCPNCVKIVKAFLALQVHAPEEVTS